MKISAQNVKSELKKLADPKKARESARFFKTGKGQYGEGDTFLGIKVPVQRAVAKKFIDLPLIEIKKLLQSKIHEHRFTALEILVTRYEKEKTEHRKQ